MYLPMCAYLYARYKTAPAPYQEDSAPMTLSRIELAVAAAKPPLVLLVPDPLVSVVADDDDAARNWLW